MILSSDTEDSPHVKRYLSFYFSLDILDKTILTMIAPCGTGIKHVCCSQFNYCLFGETPVGCVIANPADKFNAKLMAVMTWALFASLIAVTITDSSSTIENSYGVFLRETLAGAGPDFLHGAPWHKVWCYGLIINCVLSIFTTEYCILICNVFKAKPIANQAWCVPLMLIAIVFLNAPFEGYALMCFGMGWSVAMFVVTAKWALPYGAAVAFLFFSVLAGIPAASAGVVTNYWASVYVASWLFGFCVWSSMEGYAHVHQFAFTPDSRLWQYNGPITVEIPSSKEMPQAYYTSIPSDS